MHWRWKNCPTAYAGQYQGKDKCPSVVLEAVATYDLRFWHAFFGSAGSNNDINIVDRSPLIDQIIRGGTTSVRFEIEGNIYNQGYYLVDGIYPQWSCFVATVRHPATAKLSHFAKLQESSRKDIERAFGVLQSKFHIVKEPCRFWGIDKLHLVMRTCIILHNMIINDEKNVDDGNQLFPQRLESAGIGPDSDNDQDQQSEVVSLELAVEPESRAARSLQWIISQRKHLKDKTNHIQLRNDLVEHLWRIKGTDICQR